MLAIKDDSNRLRGKKINSPGLILWGMRDRMLRSDLVRWLDRQFTNPPRKVSFPDAGHWVIEARPDEIARQVIGFLDGDLEPGWQQGQEQSGG